MIEIPYSELAEFKLFPSYLAYLTSQFNYPLEIIEAETCYQVSFQEEREAERGMLLYNIFKENIKLNHTTTRKLNNDEFVDFLEWCYTNINSGWLIFEYNSLPDLFEWNVEIPIFVESLEEMVLLKLKWC